MGNNLGHFLSKYSLLYFLLFIFIFYFGYLVCLAAIPFAGGFQVSVNQAKEKGAKDKMGGSQENLGMDGSDL